MRWSKSWPTPTSLRPNACNAPRSSGASRGESASAIAARVGLDGETVRKRIRRFNVEGLEALKDRHRSGRRRTYTPEQTATVIATALTKPETLGLPFATWTLDRLAAYLHEAKGVAIQRSRIHEILLHEGLRWHKHETWFGERVDPAFAEKRSHGPVTAGLVR
jgi:transposase